MIKKIVLLIPCLLLVLKVAAQGVAFQDLTLNQAIEKAKTEDKYVFIDFYTSWCGPCKLMDAQVFPKEDVGTYFNEKFVSLKVNAESGVEGAKLANKYKIRAYPTFVILDDKGDLVHMFAGGLLDTQKFIAKVETSFDASKAFGMLQQRYDAGKRDNATVSAYLQALIGTSTIKPDSLVNNFYDTLSDQEKVSEEAAFIFERFAPIDSDKAIFLETHRDEFRDVLGKNRVDSILVSKYEQYFGIIAKGYTGKASVEGVNEKFDHVNSLGISNLKAIPAFTSAAMLQLTESGKDDVLKEINNAIPNISEREKDLMLYILIPGIKKYLTDEEKDNLLKLVDDEGVKGYVIRSVYR
ncbi:thioredoxin family protein [Aestuariibaculum sp. YM273]|uniref:thioredoxin family protein n=1 Tax=Aestuariibaculum sp. YM273 TaxID=3070659 RepID=UPI0027DBCEC4|nr:thioredoxin family protein [Aestuariibaculum sp. YM273]WMI64138.1 thioredoxin family protein [Aestuariibaculum sp. YM273]